MADGNIKKTKTLFFVRSNKCCFKWWRQEILTIVNNKNFVFCLNNSVFTLFYSNEKKKTYLFQFCQHERS